MQIVNDLPSDAFPGHEIVVYERGGRLVIVVNRDRCLARPAWKHVLDSCFARVAAG